MSSPSRQACGPPTGRTVEVTLVSAEGCHHCRRARAALEQVAADRPVHWREVDWASAEGQRLQAAHRPPFPPLLVAGGHALGHGRVSVRRLRRQVDALVDGTAP